MSTCGRVFWMHIDHAQTHRAPEHDLFTRYAKRHAHALQHHGKPSRGRTCSILSSDGTHTTRLLIPNACSSTASMAAPGPGCQGALPPASASVSIYGGEASLTESDALKYRLTQQLGAAIYVAWLSSSSTLPVCFCGSQPLCTQAILCPASNASPAGANTALKKAMCCCHAVACSSLGYVMTTMTSPHMSQAEECWPGSAFLPARFR